MSRLALVHIASATLLTLCLASCSEQQEPRVGRGDTVAGGTTDTSLLPTPPFKPVPPVGTDSSAQWVVNTTGLGSIEIGTSRTEVERVLGHRLIGPDSTSECYHLQSPQLPGRVLFMFTEGTLARIQVDSGALSTTAGARVGDTREKIESLYPGQVKATPHKYDDGEYLSIPLTGTSNHLIFESIKGVVARYRIGRLPEVEWVEGCS